MRSSCCDTTHTPTTGPTVYPEARQPSRRCSFWLADALHGIGEADRAEARFTTLLGLRNDVGMLSEEYEVATGQQLGNTPQGFSLVGLVNAGLHLDPSDRGESSTVADTATPDAGPQPGVSRPAGG